MTANEIAAVVDKIVGFRENGLTFEVRIVDVKTVYGRDLYLIRPKVGAGEKWVVKDKLLF